MRRAFGKRDEKFFVECGETALDSAQTQTAFPRDGPVRKTEREIIKSFSFKFGQQRTLKRILECRIDHVRAVLQHRSDETQETRFGIVLVNEAIRGRRIDGLYDLANLVDVNLVRKLSPENDACFRKVAPDRARRFDTGKLRHLNVEDAHLRF